MYLCVRRRWAITETGKHFMGRTNLSGCVFLAITLSRIAFLLSIQTCQSKRGVWPNFTYLSPLIANLLLLLSVLKSIANVDSCASQWVKTIYVFGYDSLGSSIIAIEAVHSVVEDGGCVLYSLLEWWLSFVRGQSLTFLSVRNTIGIVMQSISYKDI